MKNKATGLLVVGYGNPLNGDDGAGWSAAVELETLLKNTPHADQVEIMVLHQLTSELAETIGRFRSVIFIGVCRDKSAGVVNCRDIQLSAEDTENGGVENSETVEMEDKEKSGLEAENPKNSEKAMSGQISPESVIHLARTKYNASPEAFLYTIGGLLFEQGENVSRPVKRAIQFVVENIREMLLRDFGHPESFLVDDQSKGLIGTASLDIAEVV